MLTEEEAKTKACFRAATFGGSQQLANGPGPNCIGSDCMAWRWGAISGRDGFTCPTKAQAERLAADLGSSVMGYCGAAGAGAGR